ncbi:hypothetical protein ASF04_25525 [Duganella sp. Leaf61]|nr:hypothetical protein ASF04_25525 [Duganella sp. Leaf61]
MKRFTKGESVTRITTDLFMWPYQYSFRASVEVLARGVLEELGAPGFANALLVGVRAPGSDNRNAVCVEPEKERWPLDLFAGLPESVESTVAGHKLQNMFYGDEASMRDKPEWIRQDSVGVAVALALAPFDVANDVTSFCGGVRRVDDFYVATVVQIPNATLARFPALPPFPNSDENQSYGYRGLIQAAMSAVLKEATTHLTTPEPGRDSYGAMRSRKEIVQIAANGFLATPVLSIGHRYVESDIFAFLNLVASMVYEGAKGVGRLVFIDQENPSIDFLIRFREPVPFTEPRWIRKVLQMAAPEVDIITDGRHAYGLGKLQGFHDENTQDAFTVAFLDQHYWELKCGQSILLRCRMGIPELFKEFTDQQTFKDSYHRMFPDSSDDDVARILELVQFQISLPHGSMVVVSDDAQREAIRLAKQGTLIVPTPLSKVLLGRISGIDGTVLVDPYGICYAFGIILDGEANDECTPARGSRYNSGVRYVRSRLNKRLAIVVSEDRTVDVVPKLRPLASRSVIEKSISDFESASRKNYLRPRNWLDEHRFYFNNEQCIRLNNAVDRLDALPYRDSSIYISTKRFSPHPDMDDGYLVA